MNTMSHRTIRPVLMLALVPALALSAGCTTDITDPGDRDDDFVLGVIQPSAFVGRADPRTSAVAMGDTLIVQIDTFGDRLCNSKGELRLDMDRAARRLTVSPFDRFHGGACFDQGVTYEHADTIRLSSGTWTVIFRGQAVFIPHARVITVEHTVEIPGAS